VATEAARRDDCLEFAQVEIADGPVAMIGWHAS
jgi:hypothetical protein